MSDIRQLCTFYVADFLIGVDVHEVQEVIRFQDMTAVPLAPAVIAGLINLRGEIVTAIDLRRQLGLAERDPEQPPMNIVIRDGSDDAVSLLVDDIGDVIDIDTREFEPLPPTLTGPARQLLLGCYKLPDQLLLLLDTNKAQTAGTGVTDQGDQL